MLKTKNGDTIGSGGPHTVSAAADNRTDAEIFLTRAEAAEYLRCSVPTLERWARIGYGPDFIIAGRKALYSLRNLRRFAGVEAA